MKKRPPPGSTTRARRLRRDATEAERTMLRLLRANFPEARFRFQVPIRHYFADFASHRVRLIVEVDGGQHSNERDVARTAALEAEGYRVVRFWNNDVLGNGDGCMTMLADVLRQPHPHPSSASSLRSKLRYPSPIEGGGIADGAAYTRWRVDDG